MTLGIITNKQGKAVFLEHAFMTSTTTTKASQFKIGTGQVLLDQFSADLTNPVFFTGIVEYKDFTAGFPTLSTVTTPEVTMNMRVGANEGTGNQLDAIAIFNKDSTPKLLIQMNHSAESKSSQDEFVYIIRNRVL